MEFAYFLMLGATALSIWPTYHLQGNGDVRSVPFRWPTFEYLLIVHERRSRREAIGFALLVILYIVSMLGLYLGWQPIINWSDPGLMMTCMLGSTIAWAWLLRLLYYVHAYSTHRKFSEAVPRFENCLGPKSAYLYRHFTSAFVFILGLSTYLLSARHVLVGPPWLWSLIACLAAYIVAAYVSSRISSSWLIPVESVPRFGDACRAAGEAFGTAVKPDQITKWLMAEAYAGRNGQVGMTTASLEILDDRELVSIVIHEMAHLRRGDHKGLKEPQRPLCVLTIGLFLIPYALMSPSSWLSEGSCMWLAVVLGSGWQVAIAIGRALESSETRGRELHADKVAARQFDALTIATALAKSYYFNCYPADWQGLTRWTSTHPSLRERVQALGLQLDEVLEHVDGESWSHDAKSSILVPG